MPGWTTTRGGGAARRNLTDPQRALAERLAVRAQALRAEAGRDGGEGLSVADAVALAAVQLGLQPPTPDA